MMKCKKVKIKNPFFLEKENQNLVKELENERNIKEILANAFELAYDGIVIVDKNGYISMISNVYKEFLGIKNENVVGKHVTEVIENTRMHIVAQEGKSEIADIQRIKENYVIASRIPIIKNGEVVGALGKVLFKDVGELDALYNRIQKMERELQYYREKYNKESKAKYSFDNIIGESEVIKDVKISTKKLANVDSNVLIMGESGTGKELFAHAIHDASSRAKGPFVKVNCAAIPSELLESELFGYESGAFTGAKKDGKKGKFELADKGTIFLDEIGDMPLYMQAKLLGVLQDKDVERVGADKPRHVDVKIIAATNKDLECLVNEGGFRSDLFYRLNVLTIKVPPLRERTEDLDILANHFLDKIARKTGKLVKGLSTNTINCLKNYSWPGNIRELENVLEKAVNVVEDEQFIELSHLPLKIRGTQVKKPPKPLREVLKEAEKKAIFRSLEFTNGNKSESAKLLGISRTSLYEKIEKYSIIVRNS